MSTEVRSVDARVVGWSDGAERTLSVTVNCLVDELPDWVCVPLLKVVVIPAEDLPPPARRSPWHE
jgi:hypothetical protein